MLLGGVETAGRADRERTWGQRNVEDWNVGIPHFLDECNIIQQPRFDVRNAKCVIITISIGGAYA